MLQNLSSKFKTIFEIKFMKIPFEKLSSYGNNFIIIDEISKQYIPESKKNYFSKNVTDINFGIGSDGFITIQQCTLKVLSKINDARSYWKTTPLQINADYIFRMFEPDGSESLCCGNGLMCTAYYLYKTKGITSSRVLTEIPTKSPVVRTLGYDKEKQEVWVNMGTPVKVPFFLFNSMDMELCDTNIYKAHFNINLNRIANLINIPGIDPCLKQQFSLTGYLIFTGEPHLIFLLEPKKYNNTLVGSMFVKDGHMRYEYATKKDMKSLKIDLVYAIGKYFNNNLRDVFPCGININFINYIEDANVIEQRCFERGIEKETLACGTGMVASAYLLRTLNIVKNKSIHIHPVKCRNFRPNAKIEIEIRGSEYFLYGIPARICTGTLIPSPQAVTEWKNEGQYYNIH